MAFGSVSGMNPGHETQRCVSSTLDQVEAERFGNPELVTSLERVVDYVATNRTGGSSALASLLLNCYDGSEYSFDITELCRLDDDYFADAHNVIRLRTRHNREPHDFFDERGDLFNQIADDFGIRAKSEVAQES